MAKKSVKKVNGIKTSIVPEGMTKLDIRCYLNSDVQEIVLPSSIREIGWDAFKGCTKLKAITLAEGLENIRASSFKNTPIERIVIPKTVKLIGDHAFYMCEKLTSVVL